jgi:hypothetical protein
MRVAVGVDRRTARAQLLDREIAMQPQREECRDERGERGEDDPAGLGQKKVPGFTGKDPALRSA